MITRPAGPIQPIALMLTAQVIAGLTRNPFASMRLRVKPAMTKLSAVWQHLPYASFILIELLVVLRFIFALSAALS